MRPYLQQFLKSLTAFIVSDKFLLFFLTLFLQKQLVKEIGMKQIIRKSDLVIVLASKNKGDLEKITSDIGTMK